MRRGEQPDYDPDILDTLFGDPALLSDDELDALYRAVEPDVDPAQRIYNIAEAAAVQYRLRGKTPPEHTQAALDATRDLKTLNNAPLSKLRQIIHEIKTPFTGAVRDPAFAYRNRDGELDSHDQSVIDSLTDELEKDWRDDRSDDE